jgi:acetylornithine deacetylase
MAKSRRGAAVLDDLRRLVGFPTVSERPNVDLVRWLADRLDRPGWRVDIVEDPLQPGKCGIVASAGPPGTDGLLVSGHLDVVPTEGQPWNSDPFVLTQRENRLYGRGTADMKGFVAATLHALDDLDTSQLQRELLLAWTWDEEVGCLGSAHLASLWRRDGRPVPSACLIGEPTGFQVFRMHAGHTSLRVRVSGAAAHSSRPDLGINAIEGAAEVVMEIRQWARDLRERVADLPGMAEPWTKVNVGQIRGGTAVNIVPDHCELEVGIRPVPGTHEPDLIADLTRRLQNLALPTPFVVERLHGIRALHTPPGTELERILLAYADRPEVGAAPFATDGGNLVDAGTAPLVFGPGSIDVAHQADEFVALEDLFRAGDVLRAVVTGRCVH